MWKSIKHLLLMPTLSQARQSMSKFPARWLQKGIGHLELAEIGWLRVVTEMKPANDNATSSLSEIPDPNCTSMTLHEIKLDDNIGRKMWICRTAADTPVCRSWMPCTYEYPPLGRHEHPYCYLPLYQKSQSFEPQSGHGLCDFSYAACALQTNYTATSPRSELSINRTSIRMNGDNVKDNIGRPENMRMQCQKPT